MTRAGGGECVPGARSGCDGSHFTVGFDGTLTNTNHRDTRRDCHV
jgi:CDGSH-type Zn-finger protein